MMQKISHVCALASTVPNNKLNFMDRWLRLEIPPYVIHIID